MSGQLRESCRLAADVLRLVLGDTKLDSYGSGWTGADSTQYWNVAEVADAVEAGNVSLHLAERLTTLLKPLAPSGYGDVERGKAFYPWRAKAEVAAEAEAVEKIRQAAAAAGVPRADR